MFILVKNLIHVIYVGKVLFNQVNVGSIGLIIQERCCINATSVVNVLLGHHVLRVICVFTLGMNPKDVLNVVIGPRRNKTCLWGFRQSWT